MRQSELNAEDAALVRGWTAYVATKGEADFPAWDSLTQVTYHDLEHGWTLTLALVDTVEADNLPEVGAGPLENLITTFPQEIGGRAALQASKDPRFRAALERVWISRSRTPPDVREQLVVATDGKILILS